VPQGEMTMRLFQWIEATDNRAMMVTDSPDFDFEFVKALKRSCRHPGQNIMRCTMRIRCGWA